MSVIQFRENGLTPDSPCDAEPLAFHPAHGVGEAFLCTDALSPAHGIMSWVAICFAVECAGALGWWLFT